MPARKSKGLTVAEVISPGIKDAPKNGHNDPIQSFGETWPRRQLRLGFFYMVAANSVASLRGSGYQPGNGS